MNKEEFWKTIESVNHSVPDGNHEMVAKQMCEELLHYSPQDILDWHLILREYTNAAYRNDLWAACTALGAHSSDDGFIDFRTWLISQGKDIYMDARLVCVPSGTGGLQAVGWRCGRVSADIPEPGGNPEEYPSDVLTAKTQESKQNQGPCQSRPLRLLVGNQNHHWHSLFFFRKR